METGEIETSETEIIVVDTENEDRIEVPNEDVEQRGTDSKTSGRKKTKKTHQWTFKYLKVQRTPLRILSQGQVNGVLKSPSHSWL